MRDLKTGDNKSSFVKHLQGNNHSVGLIQNTMDVLYITNNGSRMNTLDKFYIYTHTHTNKTVS